MSKLRQKRNRRSRVNRNNGFSQWIRRGNGLGRSLAFESLEARCLLSAEPFYTAQSALEAFDLTLRVEEDGAVQRLGLFDSDRGQAVFSTPLSQITDTVIIEGSRLADVLRIYLDLTTVRQVLPAGIVFRGSEGTDTLVGPDPSAL